jgi:CheY-like chemotaxis protein
VDESSRPTRKLLLAFIIEDTGPGIAQSEMPTLFDPFTQAANNRRGKEGTGLGLAISSDYARLMGGTLTAKSEVGVGSTFTFTIPVKPSPTGVISTERMSNQVTGVVPHQPEYCILIVEDDPDNCEMLEQLLTIPGLCVHTASDGEAGLKASQKWQPDMIFMDIRMPVMDGYEATRRIKASPSGENTPIIAITAGVFKKERAKALAAGCDDIIIKPLRAAEVFARLEQYLGTSFIHTRPVSPPRDDIPRPAEQPASRQLTDIPPELIRELNQAAGLIDKHAALATIENIRKYNPQTADELAALAKGFKFSKLFALTSPHEN